METAEFHAATASLDAAAANKHLSDIGLAVTATRGCTHCTGGRIRKAIDGGIPRDAVIAAVDLAAAVNAGVTVRTAIAGAEQAGAGNGCTGAGCVGADAVGQR